MDYRNIGITWFYCISRMCISPIPCKFHAPNATHTLTPSHTHTLTHPPTHSSAQTNPHPCVAWIIRVLFPLPAVLVAGWSRLHACDVTPVLCWLIYKNVVLLSWDQFMNRRTTCVNRHKETHKIWWILRNTYAEKNYITEWMNGWMNGVLGNNSALQCNTGPGTTGANEMKWLVF